MKLSVLQRLPQFYHWYAGEVGSRVEPTELPEVFDDGMGNNGNLIGLKLLGYPSAHSWEVMGKISQYLNGINIQNSVIEVDGEPCLFVNSNDEAIALGYLKNLGVAIADFIPLQPHN
ncbi:YejG family protein [Pragia fontium]|uniref:YejG-like protein n=2 Tax=Pragia fontium TaxID=82985 RepID=A0AAJ4WB02_9GAMM|nr:hypothetical protein [Pragia fontium]SFC91159.1 YejG-like protein [Pragia fontium DSM 5563 = ATCC 49100]SUB83043.1 Uncharacterised protein [Pragia fontium]VEJ55942.1 Uncharacterised protein [Pragia fontium]